MSEDQTYYCERCGEKLNPKAMVYLELSTVTGLYTDPEVIDIGPSESEGGESQGCFTFGKACAKAVLKAGGDCVRTERARRHSP